MGAYPAGASACGALDMAGNVWEWTSSVYQPYPYIASDGRERAESTEWKILRGGSWNVFPAGARAADRVANAPTDSDGRCGFRVVVKRASPGS